ncbi:hypothetical protein M8C21_013536 [Ambrosia artemisiifolia]|uniref:Bet v I/Major latex protein domain-containing protein n=1 Tax=Ambrosia artemisiifolia TaxID=4212 RepID=A0AAD5G9W1_AMBAR|nr:hypothetical protein M8C21_013536 [Ambrosia artemisiifolia]
MPLSGTIVKQVNIKSDSDMFHETFRYRPYHISQMSPDGKPQVVKEVIEAIDKENKLVRFKVTEGDIMEAYKTFAITIRVDTHGEENVVTCTLDYEKVNEYIPNPDRLMELVLIVAKDVETYHLLHLQPN